MVRFGAQGNEPPMIKIKPPIQHFQIEAERLDRLTEDEKHQHVQAFCQQTGFPEMRETADRIEAHVKSAMIAAKKTQDPTGLAKFIPNINFKIIWSGYNKECPVAQGEAMPGDTPEGWVMLIRGTPRQTYKFEQHLTSLLDQQLIRFEPDLVSSPFNIVFQETLMEYGDFPYTAELRPYLNRQGLLLNVNGVHQDPYEILPQVRMALQAAIIAETLRDGKTLLDYRKLGDGYLSSNHLYKNCTYFKNNRKPRFDDPTRKQIEQARQGLANHFKYLPPEDQFVVVRIFQWVNQGIFFDMRRSEENPYGRSLEGLRNLGLLYPNPNQPEKLIPYFVNQEWLQQALTPALTQTGLTKNAWDIK